MPPLESHDGRLWPRRAAYLILAALAVLSASFHLGPTVIAGMFAYTIIDATHRRLAARMRPAYARWLSLTIFLIAAALLAWLCASFLRQSLTAIPNILEQAMPRLRELSQRYKVEIPFENIDELRRLIADTVKENAPNITRAGGLLTKGFFHVLLGIFTAILCFMSGRREDYGANLYDALCQETGARVWRFMQSFEQVLGAQVIISAINTALTAVFLLSLGFPQTAFLIPATFFLGILPVIGNLLSNTIIVCTALTISPRHAVLALGFLVLIHKGEYVLNSKIIGSSIKAPMWQTLLGILLGEVVLGVPGIILAPAVLHYVRREMQEIPLPAPAERSA